MPETPTVMITKVLLPRKQPGLLHRQRLVDFIHEHIDRKLVLVSASAGYGKTSLLVDFAHDTDLPVCWYSVDKADRDPRVFLEYLMASIRQQFPDFGPRTESALTTMAKTNGQLKTLISTLVNDIHDVPDYFALIIDDYHFVDESQEVNPLVDDLLRYLPENCHLVISSRTLPHLIFSRLIAHQEGRAGRGASPRVGGLDNRHPPDHSYDMAGIGPQHGAGQGGRWTDIRLPGGQCPRAAIPRDSAISEGLVHFKRDEPRSLRCPPEFSSLTGNAEAH
jgi:hypothetical protein